MRCNRNRVRRGESRASALRPHRRQARRFPRERRAWHDCDRRGRCVVPRLGTCRHGRHGRLRVAVKSRRPATTRRCHDRRAASHRGVASAGEAGDGVSDRMSAGWTRDALFARGDGDLRVGRHDPSASWDRRHRRGHPRGSSQPGCTAVRIRRGASPPSEALRARCGLPRADRVYARRPVRRRRDLRLRSLVPGVPQAQ